MRGLDYYTRTAFEFYVRGREGQQQALGGGGRYDGLVELLGGRPTPGIGFGIGLDRLILALAEQGTEVTPTRDDAPTAVVVGADPEATAERLRIATTCALPASRRARSSGIGSWASSSRRPPATRPTSRSSSATSSRTGRSR